MNVFVVGDSHVVSLSLAAHETPEILSALPGATVRFGKLFSFPAALADFHYRLGSVIRFRDDQVESRLKAATGLSELSRQDDSLYVFSFPFTTTIVLGSETWTRFRPWELEPDTHHALSERLLGQISEYHYQHVLNFLRDVQSLGVRYCVMEAPPVRRDDNSVVKGPLCERSAVQVDRVIRAWMRGRMCELGIGVIDCPPEAYSGDVRGSYLRSELHDQYYDGDHHHANATYGRLMLARLLNKIRSDPLWDDRSCAHNWSVTHGSNANG